MKCRRDAGQPMMGSRAPRRRCPAINWGGGCLAVGEEAVDPFRCFLCAAFDPAVSCIAHNPSCRLSRRLRGPAERGGEEDARTRLSTPYSRVLFAMS